jgi:4'-phosphopantetheinyl transferase
VSPVVGFDGVDVYIVELDRPEPEVAALAVVLSPEERGRVGGQRFERHRRRFTVCRAALRQILAGRVGGSAESVTISLGEHGKPCVANGPPFNVAHSYELALIAVNSGAQDVGVDLERIAPDREVGRLASRYLSPVEREALGLLPDDERGAAFHWCWTAKEACLKAVGVGLTEPLDSFDVSVDMEAPPILTANRGPLGEGPWTLRRLYVADGYAATLAVAAGECDVRERRWVPGGGL